MATIQLHRLLCPIELSDASRHALEHAIALSKWCSAGIAILHVYHMPIPLAPLAGPAIVPRQPTVDPRQLEDNVRRFWRSGSIAQTSSSIAAHIAAFFRAASESCAEAIFMGVHGRGVIDRMLFGSTTHNVIRRAPCPVLTVRA